MPRSRNSSPKTNLRSTSKGVSRRAWVAGLASLAPASLAVAQPERSITVESPNRQVRITFELLDQAARPAVPAYSVWFTGKPLIVRATLGVSFADSGPLVSGLRVVHTEQRDHDERYPLFPGKTSMARDHYREAVISLQEQSGRGRRFDLLFRAYDDGAAFRYRFPQQAGLQKLELTAEYTTFAFTGNPRAWVLPLPTFTTPYETFYRQLPLQDIAPDPLIGLPLLLQYPDGICVAVTEADLKDYAGMYVSASGEGTGVLTCRLSPRQDDPQLKVKAALPHVSPWRVLMIAPDPGRLIESNLITSLNPPSAIADTSWIKPGKTTFPWWNGYALDDAGHVGGQDTRTHKQYIDFCAEAHIPYHSLDGLDNVAWYSGPIVPYRGADLTKSLPEIDLPELLAYARQKGVRLRLWMSSAAARAQMKKAFPVYEQWGIEGVMVDFFERDDQEMVNFVHELLALAAKHHLTVTLHNISKPTGLRRTWPHLLTTEAAFNAEYNKWHAQGSTPGHQMILPFVRMLAGPIDYHSGSFHNVTAAQFKTRNAAPLTVGTRARELARYVVYEGYLPMVADFPAAYRNQPGLEFLSAVPTFWDETRVLSGMISQHITVARRHGTQWYIGSMTDGSARQLDIPMRFLGKGRYRAKVYADDLSMPDEPSRVTIQDRSFSSADTIKAALAPAGGHVVVLTPA